MNEPDQDGGRSLAPVLRGLVVGDDPAAWRAAGFAVDPDGATTLGSVAVTLVGGDRRGVLRCELATSGAAVPAKATEADGLDGIAVTVVGDSAAAGSSPTAPGHANRVDRLDHVVVATPDLARTIAALQRWGFEVRRQRDVPDSQPLRRQVFLWAGEPIIEVVGPAEPDGEQPARIWGLALATDDLDQAAAVLGPAMATPRPAVQPGRTIAAIRTRDLDISLPLALMSPHTRS